MQLGGKTEFKWKTISMYFDATLASAKRERAEDGVNLLDLPECAEVIIMCRQGDENQSTITAI